MHDGYCYFTTDDGKFYIDYLDTDGTTLKRKPISGPGKSIEYIVGTQTASTNAWTGNSKDDELWIGKTIAYKIPYAGTSSAAILTLTLANGTVVTKTLRRQGSNSVTTQYPAGTVLFLTYDGTYWQTDGDYDSNDGHYFLRRIYTNIKAGANGIFPYTFIMQLPDGRWESLVTSSSQNASKIVNQHGFLLGNIYTYYYNGTSYSENQNLATYSTYSSYGSLIDHRYSFNTENNATNGTTGYKPIYLVGSLHSDGLFYLDTTKWWTQTLPTSADGKLYIYLGDAYDYYRMVFAEQNPIYQYVNGAIRQFTQDAGTINGLTVQTAVPQNALFTDYKVRQTNDTSNTNFRVLLSNSANDTQEDNITHKSTNLQYNPSTNKLSTGNLDLTGNLAVTGNATLSNETNIASATIGTLQVNGNANFVQSPTAPTPAAATNDTTVATTAFVKSQIAAGVTGVKGNAESSYRVGQVNLTPANIGALALSGGTLTGLLNLQSGVYSDSYTGALNMNNSNIYGLNSIYTADAADNAAEGIHFYRDSTHVDTLWMSGGDLLFVPNRALGTSTSKADSQKVGRFTVNPTSGQVVITDGTTGGMKSSGYTIATSVPSGAVFTDTKNTAGSTQTSGDLFLVGATSQAANPQTYSSSQLKFINSTNTLYTQNAELTGTLVVTGQTTLNDNLSAQGITATDLIVNGATRFNAIPLSVTPEATSNDNSIATTAFVKNAAAGLSGAMHFRGTTTSAIVDGSTTNPITINGASYTAAAGDVVLREVSTGNVFEYVWTGSAWEMLGRDTSFKVTQTAVTKPTAVTNKWVSAIGQNANGEISVDYATLDTSGTWSGNAATATKATQDGNGLNIANNYFKSRGNISGGTDLSEYTTVGSYLNATGNNTSNPNTGFQTGYGYLISVGNHSDTYQGVQVEINHTGTSLYYRTHWSSWKTKYKILTSANTVAVAEGGTGVTSIADIKAGKDGDGNIITTTYLTKATGVTSVSWDSTNKKIQKTINGTTTDVVQVKAGDGIGVTAAAGEVTISSKLEMVVDGENLIVRYAS